MCAMHQINPAQAAQVADDAGIGIALQDDWPALSIIACSCTEMGACLTQALQVRYITRRLGFTQQHGHRYSVESGYCLGRA